MKTLYAIIITIIILGFIAAPIATGITAHQTNMDAINNYKNDWLTSGLTGVNFTDWMVTVYHDIFVKYFVLSTICVVTSLVDIAAIVIMFIGAGIYIYD